MPQPACSFVWHELMTTDTAAATAFYTAVLGYATTTQPMPDGDYVLLAAGGTQVAGLMALPAAAAAAGARPGWTGYVAVPDVDAKAAVTATSTVIKDLHAVEADLLDQLGVDYAVFASAGTSEDIAMLLAFERGAALIVATHDHQEDQRAIEWGIGRGFHFVGGVGSRAKAARTRERLAHKGLESEAGRVRMPIGLDIGARSPTEIAVSIAAELIGLRRELAEARDKVESPPSESTALERRTADESR